MDGLLDSKIIYFFDDKNTLYIMYFKYIISDIYHSKPFDLSSKFVTVKSGRQ